MKIACIDDMSEEGAKLLSLAKTRFELFGVPVEQSDLFSCGNTFFQHWKPGLYQMVFVDIFLEKEHGIDIAKTIRKFDCNVSIVFCSSSNAFASESYDAKANYYLVKPVSPQLIDHMIQQLQLPEKTEDMVELPNRQMLLLSRFLYSEYHNHLITLYLKNGQTEKIWSSQADFLSIMSPFPYLLAVTPGTLLNLKEVVSFADDCFLLSDGTKVPISKRKKKELLAQYKHFLFMELRRD